MISTAQSVSVSLDRKLTAAGKSLFHRLLRIVVAYDYCLRTVFDSEEIDVLSVMLARLRSNGAADDPG